jgi:hypothetical protein
MMAFSVAEKAPPPPAAADCVRLAGEQIGQLPLSVQVGGQQVEFLEWKATDITASELIGFTAQAADEIRFTVEAGDREFAAGSNWLHPAGVVGPQVKAIRSVTVCAR